MAGTPAAGRGWGCVTKPLLFVFELEKTPNVDKKSFVLVVNEFWGCVGLSFEYYCWLVLVWIGLVEWL